VTEATVAAKSAAPVPSDQAARLRSAAAAGKTAEVEGLLTAGVPIDAADANGDTALIRSIQADKPSVAAILRRHGASLDHRNNAGQSARDIAKAAGDAELNQALGLPP
jgi:ankyrin repeat protein